MGSALDKIVFDYNNGSRVVSKSAIFTQNIVNNYITSYMDSVFKDVAIEDGFYETIQKLKTAFNVKEIESYNNEIEALLKLKDVKNLVESEDFNFTSGVPRGAVILGRKLDTSLSVGSKVVDKSIINEFIVQKLDEFFTNYADMESELVKIEQGFNDSVEKYEVERK